MSMTHGAGARRPLLPEGAAWKFRDFVMVACSAAVLPKAFSVYSGSVEAMIGAGASPGPMLALSALKAGGVVLAVAVGSRYLADPTLAAAKIPAAKVGKAALDATARITRFFDAAGIDMAFRKSVVTRDRTFAAALRRGLEGAGAPHSLVNDRWATVVSADMGQIDIVVDQVLRLAEFAGADRTLIAPAPFGDAAPCAMRRLADGTSAATWVDHDGSPIRTVGYGTDGNPTWIHDHVTGRPCTSQQELFDEPNRSRAQLFMAASLKAVAATYVATREAMAAAIDPGTHTLFVRDGFVEVRDRQGRLDSPTPGIPAVLAPDGETTLAKAGRRWRTAPRDPEFDSGFSSGMSSAL